ncbi:AMP-binding protein [bacterium]|nr:AMP-binding protein [bacterium]
MRVFYEEGSSLKLEVCNVLDKISKKQNLILKTSGTTGTPKSIAKDLEKAIKEKRGGSEEDVWVLTYDPKRWAGVSTITHAIKFNSKLYVPKSLSFVDIIDCAHKNRVTHISTTPSIFRNMLLIDKDKKLSKTPLKQITFGGECATQSVLNLAKNNFPEARVTHIYASTEMGDICAVSDGLEGIPKGKLEKEKFKINDKDELIIEGFNTQDMWKLKNDRYYFLGREQEIINIGGIKVSPIVVEETALKCGVEFAKSYSIKNPILGNLVGLDYVGDIEKEVLKSKLKDSLSKYEMPSKINKLDSIELTKAGKIKRK